MSNIAPDDRDLGVGVGLLPRDLSQGELAVAPVMVSVDALLIEDLDEAEDEAFAAALTS